MVIDKTKIFLLKGRGGGGVWFGRIAALHTVTVRGDTERSDAYQTLHGPDLTVRLPASFYTGDSSGQKTVVQNICKMLLNS